MKYYSEFINFIIIYITVLFVLFLLSLIKNIFCKCFTNGKIIDAFFNYVLFNLILLFRHGFLKNKGLVDK